MRRLNFHVALAAAGRCPTSLTPPPSSSTPTRVLSVIVDSTRQGKRFPDAFSKTVPIWSAVINRVIARLRKERGIPLAEAPDGTADVKGDARAVKIDATPLTPQPPQRASSRDDDNNDDSGDVDAATPLGDEDDDDNCGVCFGEPPTPLDVWDDGLAASLSDIRQAQVPCVSFRCGERGDSLNPNWWDCGHEPIDTT